MSPKPPEEKSLAPQKKHNSPEYAQLLSVLLASRKNGGADGSPSQRASWRRQRSALRKGVSPQSETYAYPYVLPYIPRIRSTDQRSIALQLAALFAEFDHIPIFDENSSAEKGRRDFGTWCNRVSEALALENGRQFELDPAAPDIVANRLAYLSTLEPDQAIATVRRIMAIASKLSTPPAIDYWDLFSTFMHWGKGFSDASLHVRNRPLASYYAAFQTHRPTDG